MEEMASFQDRKGSTFPHQAGDSVLTLQPSTLAMMTGLQSTHWGQNYVAFSRRKDLVFAQGSYSHDGEIPMTEN